jgi:HSP20 family protein
MAYYQWRREAPGPFNLLQHELGRLLEEYLKTGRYGTPEPAPTDIDPSAWSPAVDVYETPDEVIVVAEVPGVDPATIDLAVTGNLMTLRGVKETNNLAEAVVQTRERQLGAFHRQLVLSNEVDFDKAQAEANHGILKIRLPKRSAAKPRTIPIRPS